VSKLIRKQDADCKHGSVPLGDLVAMKQTLKHHGIYINNSLGKVVVEVVEVAGNLYKNMTELLIQKAICEALSRK